MSKSSREAKKERIAKNYLARQGMEWSDNDALRGEAWDVAVQAVKDADLIDQSTFTQLRNLGVSIASGAWLAALAPLLKIMATKREVIGVFKSAWNPIIMHGPIPEEEAPRHQVDFATVGSKLPSQAIAMMGTKKTATEMPTWVLPAAGIAAFYLITRK